MNFIYSFKSEWLKKKRSLSSWLVITGAFFTPVIILIARLVRNDTLPAEIKNPSFWGRLWYSSWQSMAIFLLPLGVILTASLITQLEFKNNTWKQLHTTPQSLTTIFIAKLAVILVMMLQFFVLFNIGIYLSGVLPMLLTGNGYPRQPIPFKYFFKEGAYYFIDCLPIVALQYLISLQFKNFLVPVGGGIIMWILSVSVLSWKYGYAIPYSYCGLYYLRGRDTNYTVHIHLLAAAWFAGLTLLSYVLYITKEEKG